MCKPICIRTHECASISIHIYINIYIYIYIYIRIYIYIYIYIYIHIYTYMAYNSILYIQCTHQPPTARYTCFPSAGTLRYGRVRTGKPPVCAPSSLMASPVGFPTDYYGIIIVIDKCLYFTLICVHV
jgi:hypothetical protein